MNNIVNVDESVLLFDLLLRKTYICDFEKCKERMEAD